MVERKVHQHIGIVISHNISNKHRKRYTRKMHNLELEQYQNKEE